MLNKMKFKLLFFLVISFIIWIWASFADYEVIIEDVNYSWSYPSEGISMSITTNNDIVKAPTLTLKPDNPEYEDMIHAQIISCWWDNACIAKIEYDKELPTWKYTGKIIFTYQKNDNTERYTATGSYTLDIIQPDFEKDWVFVDDIIFNDIIAWYKHRKRQPVIIRNDTDKRVVMTSISVTDILSIKPIFKWEIQSEDHGIIEYNGILDEWQHTEELIIWYWEEFGKETNQITGLIILNAIPIDNIFEVTWTSIDFWQIEWWYENVDKKIITIINPTDSDIEIKEIKLDTSDNPNINEIFEILDYTLYTTLWQKEAADVATITMKRWLNVGLYTGKVEIIYQKDDKEYSIRSYLTGSIVGKETIDELTLTWSLPKDWTKFWDYVFNPKFNKNYITLKNYEIYVYDETIWDWWDWVKVEDPEHIFNTSAEYSLKMYMEIDENYTIWENTSILYYFDRFTWLDWEYFDSWIWFYDCHFWNDPFVINVTSNNEDYWTVNTSRTKARFWEHITLTATPKNWYRFKKWQTKNNIEISDNWFEMIDEDVSIQAIFEPTPSHSGWGGHHKNIVDTGDKKEHKSAKSELELAYEFALQNWIDILDNLEESTVKWWLTRIAMAKMLSQYAINILWKVPANKIVPKYKDITKELNEKYNWAIELAYQLWIMGIWIDSYRPFDLVPRSEFVTALSRMLYGLQDWTENYYSTHMDKLKKEWIITNTDPDMQELKWYVLIMLMRSAKN